MEYIALIKENIYWFKRMRYVVTYGDDACIMELFVVTLDPVAINSH